MKIQIYLINGFHYKGKLTEENEYFIVILDEKTNLNVSLAKSQILTMTEVKE